MMSLKKSLLLGAAMAALMVGCFKTGAKSQDSATKLSPEDRPMIGVQNIEPNKFYCVTTRADDRGDNDYIGNVYVGSGRDRNEACLQSQNICGSITGFGDGTGACVVVVSYDDLITGFGQVQANPTFGEGFVCFAREMPFAGSEFSQRKWPGIGATIKQAYDNAIKLCSYRGGANCQAWERCIDFSNASFNAD